MNKVNNELFFLTRKKIIYIEYIMTKNAITGGRRTRRVNAWAKAAGEYYRSHKNDSDIQDFSDVLKSPKFKAYYQSKYGKKSSRPSFNSTRKSRGQTRRLNKYVENEEKEEKEDIEEEEPIHKEKKDKKEKKEADDWSWGWESDKKNFKKDEEKNELFNGGKKGSKKNSKKGGNQQEQQE